MQRNNTVQPERGVGGSCDISRNCHWWETDINCLKYKGLKETRTMSQQTEYHKEIRNSRKRTKQILELKVANWNENFTTQFNSRFEPAKEESERVKRLIKITRLRSSKKKKLNKDLWDIIEHTNIHITKVSGEKEGGAEKKSRNNG